MTNYPGPERRLKPRDAQDDYPSGDQWNLDKKVPISLILAMIAQIVAITWFFAEIKRDVELLKADVQVLHQRDTLASDGLREAMVLTRNGLEKLNDKLDRLIEKGQK